MMTGNRNFPIRVGRLGVVLLAICLLASGATADGLFETLFNNVGSKDDSDGGLYVAPALIAGGIAVLCLAVVSILINCFCGFFMCGKYCSSRPASQPLVIAPPNVINNAPLPPPSSNNAAPPENGTVNNGNVMPEERASDLRISQQNQPSSLAESLV